MILLTGIDDILVGVCANTAMTVLFFYKCSTFSRTVCTYDIISTSSSFGHNIIHHLENNLF